MNGLSETSSVPRKPAHSVDKSLVIPWDILLSKNTDQVHQEGKDYRKKPDERPSREELLLPARPAQNNSGQNQGPLHRHLCAHQDVLLTHLYFMRRTTESPHLTSHLT
ncbi:hypothetical protein DPEC_G00324080 [Dallia pectoralis]|uniref:Uncharacterized protein n=1 Tax=Dallia pectoralis TaxID=75939 RepID=A0ACC2FB08_DALPE|nr:hypothetical protein DPEC_G00324080 [Dallia pectoralis]